MLLMLNKTQREIEPYESYLLWDEVSLERRELE